MKIGDVVRSNYPDMSGALGVIMDTKSVTYWMNGTVEQYRIEWITKDSQSIGVMWMTAESLEVISD